MKEPRRNCPLFLPPPPTPPPCFLHPSLTPTNLGHTLAVRDFTHSNQWKHRCNPTHLGKRVWLHEPQPPALESYSQAFPISGLLSASLETTLRKQRKAMQEIWGHGDLGKEMSKENKKVYNKGNNALSPLPLSPSPPPSPFPFSPFSLAQLSCCHLMSKHLLSQTYWDLTAKCCLEHGKKHGSWMNHIGESCKINVVLSLTPEKPTFLWKHLSSKLHFNLSSFKYAHSSKKF